MRARVLFVALLIAILGVHGGAEEESDPTGDAFRRRIAALADGDADGRVEEARRAWQIGLDEDSQRLAEAALRIDSGHTAAHRWLGHVRDGDHWRPGRPAPWPPAGSTGPRTGRLRSPKDAAAVRRALAWLVAHQDDDGRLDADGFEAHCPEGDPCGGTGGGHHGERVSCAFDGAATAVAVLAWLAGAGVAEGDTSEAIDRGLDYCVRVLKEGGRGFDGIWNLAYCTMAVADAAAARRDPTLRDAVEEAVARLESLQRPDGGWSYVYSIGDVPTTAAVCRALGLAAQAGVGVDPDRVTRALAFLEARLDGSTGRSEYHAGAERKGYTPTLANAAATLAARAAFGVLEETPGLGRRVRAATGRKPRWKLSFEDVKTRDGRTVRAQVGTLYPYAWSLAAFALARRGLGRAWRGSLAAALRAGQRREGHAVGSWDPLGPYSESGGRVFVTGICALMLLAEPRYPRER